MMLIPRRSNFDLLDDFFGEDDFFTKRQSNLMRTDIKEKDNNYVIEIDLPGFDKENIALSLKDGNLVISAKTIKEEKDGEEEKYLRKERYYGECSRSFYVGDEITEEDINAEFKNGTLRITLPKSEEKDKISQAKQIEIK